MISVAMKATWRPCKPAQHLTALTEVRNTSPRRCRVCASLATAIPPYTNTIAFHSTLDDSFFPARPRDWASERARYIPTMRQSLAREPASFRPRRSLLIIVDSTHRHCWLSSIDKGAVSRCRLIVKDTWCCMLYEIGPPGLPVSWGRLPP